MTEIAHPWWEDVKPWTFEEGVDECLKMIVSTPAQGRFIDALNALGWVLQQEPGLS